MQEIKRERYQDRLLALRDPNRLNAWVLDRLADQKQTSHLWRLEVFRWRN